MPQDQIAAGVDIKIVGSIGNLMLVRDPANGKADNQHFAAKLILSADGLPYDIGGVLDRSDWTATEIEARWALLAATGYDKDWKLPV